MISLLALAYSTIKNVMLQIQAHILKKSKIFLGTFFGKAQKLG